MALGIEYHTIQEIEANHPKDVKKCLEEVIDSWLRGSKEQPSWSALCTALRNKLVGRCTLANEIEQKYVVTFSDL